MKILVDEDLPRAAAELLRRLGHEAEHVRDLGLRGEPDHVIFAAAQERQAILLSADVGFANLRRYPLGTHCGVVVLRFPDYFRREDILALLDRFIESVDPTSLCGALAIVTPRAYRIRR